MIEVDAVEKTFGHVAAVSDLSFRVEAGELLVLVGASGCGKTTTLKMINRLITPSSGRVRIDGRDAADRPGHELRRDIGYCFQGVGLFPHMTVSENVAITPSLLGWPKAKIDRRVDELLELVELAPARYRARDPRDLSGGQRQRVGLARALAARPRIVLLDEPFGALDPLSRDRLQRSFQRIRRDLNLTCVFVTHDMAEALLLGDHVAVLREGRLVQLGEPGELLRDPADDSVRELLATPQRHAEWLEHLLAGAERGDP